MYAGRTLKVLNTSLALIAMAMLAVCKVASASDNSASSTRTMIASSSSGGGAPSGPGASLVFSYPSGFSGASGTIQTVTDATDFSGSVIELSNGKVGVHSAGAAWYKTPQNITAFTTDFTFQIASGLPVPSIVGITFCVQNSNSATNPLGSGSNVSADSNLAGYGAYDRSIGSSQAPVGNSIAVKFDLNNDRQLNYPSGGSPTSTGLYVNGGPKASLVPQNDLSHYGINLYSGHIMAVHIVYDGSLLTMTLKDTVTNAQFRTSWPIDIPAITGGNSAWVGFTAGTIAPVANDLLTWSFSEGYAPRLPAPSFSVAGGSYASAQSVSIGAYPGATIYYTTNGQQPTSSSSKYTGPISVSSSEVVQAIALQTGYTDSLVAVANYEIAPAATPLINFPNGFANASSLVTVNGSAQFNGSAIQLTDSANFAEAGSAWYVVPINVQSFTTNFTLQLLNPKSNGMTFTIQNQPPASSDRSILYVSGGPNAVGNNQTGLGYSGFTGAVGGQNAGLLNSVAVIFDLYNGSGDLTGLYTNGAMPTGSSIDMSSSGLSLHSGNPLNVTLAYNGTTLTMTITDSTTRASFTKSWTIDIPTTVGGNTAYVGFTGATGGLTAVQDVVSWTYSASPGQTSAVPAAPTNLQIQ
ncbi:MAG TPA: chitobiase/beta-hexosaminidase C-terminal domain-containing protein [Xanthobacteraceae bacterium]|nr:chitobiase/beta-hexosaminidase C-terminal domain-containing protein [Xanthobacteraceae bacterium]